MTSVFRILAIAALAMNLASANAFAKAIVEEEFFVADAAKQFVPLLALNKQLTLDHPSREGYEVYGPKGTREVLEKLGVPVIDIKMSNKEAPDYPSFPQVERQLQDLAARYPNIMRLSSIGKSNAGRDLYVMKISDNPAVDEVEPEAKYISSMHGNEITGRELLLRFIDEIGARYNAGDEEIVKLVNNTELFLMPSMNPDGSELRQRGNERGVDLNRDFPDFSSDPNNTPANREIETQAIMAFQAGRVFALSANFHGGSECVNYPWDTTAQRHPFDRLVQDLSHGYADLVPYIRNSQEFDGGITNGYDWYEVDGGMQDWSYHWYNDLQVTIELSNDKWPRYSEIPGFYDANRLALLHYLSSVHRGAGFRLATENKSGSVKVFSLAADGSVAADLGSYNFTRSEFYKVLEDGRYKFVVEAKDADGSEKRAEFTTVVGSTAFVENGNITRVAL